jgi:hypothetical protein
MLSILIHYRNVQSDKGKRWCGEGKLAYVLRKHYYAQITNFSYKEIVRKEVDILHKAASQFV